MTATLAASCATPIRNIPAKTEGASPARFCKSANLPFYTSRKDTAKTRVNAEALNAEYDAVCR
jgi:hypothetical protein